MVALVTTTSYDVTDPAGDQSATLEVDDDTGAALVRHDSGPVDRFATGAEAVARIQAVGGSVPGWQP